MTANSRFGVHRAACQLCPTCPGGQFIADTPVLLLMWEILCHPTYYFRSTACTPGCSFPTVRQRICRAAATAACSR
ncbi:hypothetical protein EV650_3180 [Kribbella kalugense]|uniref:Uncharacterized protein n=1 Tax=Kribbella kalugense TaxID=2512221 RepID=A0A4V3G8U9_9ACTN|nr:hypothetical protein EV650_3180 [Kribbella kalugense]